MRFGRPLLKLPIRFCGDTLAREVAALPPDAWMSHPQNFDGNISVPLVSPGGEMGHGAFGPMAPTEPLSRCPYVLGIMGELDSTWGRSRLMGLQPGAEVPEHVDIHYYWRTHLRIHIPAITNPDVTFTCDGETIHMAAGECWLLDSFYRHSVTNGGSETRIHLVLDTVGSGRLWDLIAAATHGDAQKPKFVKPGEAPARPLDFEQVNAPIVMSPWEVKAHVAYLAEWADDQPGLDAVLATLDRFLMVWSGSWARYGISEQGLPIYLRHLEDLRNELANLDGAAAVTLRNDEYLLSSIDHFILANAVAPGIVQSMQARSGGITAFRRTA